MTLSRLSGILSIMRELLTSSEVAAFLGISRTQVNRLSRNGVLQAHFVTGGARGERIFHRDEVARVSAERNLS